MTSWHSPASRSTVTTSRSWSCLCSTIWSNKDPKHGRYIAENMLAGRMKTVYLHDLAEGKDDVFILDVRENWEVEKER